MVQSNMTDYLVPADEENFRFGHEGVFNFNRLEQVPDKTLQDLLMEVRALEGTLQRAIADSDQATIEDAVEWLEWVCGNIKIRDA